MISGLDNGMLPPIDHLHFEPDSHRYQYKGKWLANSVTRVLSHDMDQRAKDYIESKRSEWEPRGNTLHNCLEHYLLGAAELNPTPYEEWWEALKNCWLWKDAEIIGVEYRMVDEKRDLAGSTDFILKTAKGTVVLGDLKTVQTKSAVDKRKPATEQLGAYLYMLQQHHQIHVDKLCTVVVGPGACRVIVDDPDIAVTAWLNKWEQFKAAQDVTLAALGF